MAAHYTALLRAAQPSGPYYLAGWCYGGLVAVEMAQQLLAENQEVAFLALLETVAPAPALTVHRYYRHRLRCFQTWSLVAPKVRSGAHLWPDAGGAGGLPCGPR